MALYPAVAGGNIAPSTFLTPSLTVNNQVLQASSGTQQLCGIAQKGQRNTPYGALQDGYAAISGEDILIFSEGETCPLELGGTVTAGVLLESNASGLGVTSTVSGHFYGALTSKAGVSGDLVEVQVLLGYHA